MSTVRSPRSRLLALALALALASAACGGSKKSDGGASGGGGATPATGAALPTIEKGKLIACSDVPYAPFEFEEGGKVVGVDADLVRAIGGRLGVAVDFRDTDFDGIFAALDGGKCDLIASAVSITEERKKKHDFSEGYFEINQSLLVRKADAGKYADLASLKGRTVAVQSATTGADFAKQNAQGANIKEFTGADDMFAALKSGQADGIVQDFPVNAYNAKTTGETVVAKVFNESKKEQYGLVLPKGKPALKKAVDEALAKVRADDTYPTILRQYLGDTAGQA